MDVTEQSPTTEAPATTGWIDVSRVACGYGMPGPVKLAPTVWLCCVYFAARQNDSTDAAEDAFRLDALLRNAATAWAQHTRATGSRPGQFCFDFNPGKPPGGSGGSTVSFNLSVTVEANNTAQWATWIEMDK